MSSFLPREWGEAGALRVSDVLSSRPLRKTIRARAQPVTEEDGDKEVATFDQHAREIRAINLARAAASRHVRASRVS